jgi:hypothetical protein
MRIVTYLCILLLAGCSQNNLLTKQNFQNSQNAFIQGDATEALTKFPRGKEDGNFITTMEKGYLSLTEGKPNIKELQYQAKQLENRVRYHVSREARTFFYVQSPEDYNASEHEVIWLHFLLSWGYSLQGEYSDACVEARIAGSLLSLPWSPMGHFDDPAMRLFLAGLWTMCGQWSEAQVDLRAAWSMDNSLIWAKDLAEQEHPPAHLFIALGGPGPEPVWNSEISANPLRSVRQVSFNLRGQKRPLSIVDQQGWGIDSHISPDASNWYDRHLARESELHEMILDSVYGTKITTGVVELSANVIGETTKDMIVGIGTGAVAGLGLLASGASSGGQTTISRTEAVDALALGAVVGGVVGGVYGAIDGYQKGSQNLKKSWMLQRIIVLCAFYLSTYGWDGATMT